MVSFWGSGYNSAGGRASDLSCQPDCRDVATYLVEKYIERYWNCLHCRHFAASFLAVVSRRSKTFVLHICMRQALEVGLSGDGSGEGAG